MLAETISTFRLMDLVSSRYHSAFGDRANIGFVRKGSESGVMTSTERGFARAVNYPGESGLANNANATRITICISRRECE